MVAVQVVLRDEGATKSVNVVVLLVNEPHVLGDRLQLTPKGSFVVAFTATAAASPTVPDGEDARVTVGAGFTVNDVEAA